MDEEREITKILDHVGILKSTKCAFMVSILNNIKGFGHGNKIT